MKTSLTLLFDLDGTLTDPAVGITRSVAHALSHFSIQVSDLSTLRSFIGPPLLEQFISVYGFSEEQAAVAVQKYRERFSTVGWSENLPYPGIDTLLSRLQEAGASLLVATSKPEPFAIRILDHFGLSPYFSHIVGAPMDAPRGYGKADVIRDALGRANIQELSAAVMIGDRHHDIDGATAVGISSVGVLWGYGSREELCAAGATYIVNHCTELEQLLLHKC